MFNRAFGHLPAWVLWTGAGYLAPREGVGTGLWIARQPTRRLEFLRSDQGFTVRAWL